MTSYVLVHGSWHGPWCWERVIYQLTSLDHRAVAVDLPILDTTAGTEEYVGAIEAAIEDPSDTVVVAHSMSGLIAPVLAQRLHAQGHGLRELVLLASLLPLPGHSWVEQDVKLLPDWTSATASLRVDAEGRSYWPPARAAEVLYHDCSPLDAAAAVEQMRPQARVVQLETSPLADTSLGRTRYIVCTKDRGIPAEWAAHTAQKRFGARIEYMETGHSPFWSHPDVLTRSLIY